jgi:hypothetical protein
MNNDRSSRSGSGLTPATLAIAALLLAAAPAYRLLHASYPDLINFSPMVGLVFCAAIYFSRRWAVVAGFGALLASDMLLNARYGFPLVDFGMGLRYAALAGVFALGAVVASRKNWLTLLGGVAAGSLLFVAVSNTASWIIDPGYSKSLAGWVQALTVGLPGFPPTWVFFRNAFASDMIFTVAFVALLEAAALRQGLPSLWVRVQPARVAA